MCPCSWPETTGRDQLYTICAATRSGGLWKTTNNGITLNQAFIEIEEVAGVDLDLQFEGGRRVRVRSKREYQIH